MKIKLVVFDFDGVFTDGTIAFDANGNAIKHYNSKDGMGVFNLRKAGFEIGVISGWLENTSQKAVLTHLGINRMSLGSNDKLGILSEWCKELGIGLHETAYMGDDINDRDVMGSVGISACPCDAMPEIVDIADYICKKNGGKGAIREFSDWLIEKN